MIQPEIATLEAGKGFVKALSNTRQPLRGWRFGVLLCSAMASFALVTNCIAAIVIHSKYGTQKGVSTAFEGDCHFVNQLSLGLHVLINVLSSLLLSASNYTMQVLNAPTRSECDKAHARGDWLDIGITSLQNISKISWQRRLLWLLLGLSSVPIHLFYNSAVFKTIDTNHYAVAVATPLFLQNDALPPSHINESTGPSDIDRQAHVLGKLDHANLTSAECIDAYGAYFVTGYSDVIAVISGPYPANESYITGMHVTPEIETYGSAPYNWYASPIRMTLLSSHMRDGGGTILFP